MAQALEFNLTVVATATEVFRAFTRATPLRDWLCDVASADARPGGRIYLWWNRGYFAAGEYTVLEPVHRLTFTWMGRGDPDHTEVDVQLEPRGACTDLRLVHSGLGEGEAWARTRAEFERGWTLALENLQSLLETGQDLRYTRRPMLGVTLDEFNPEVAAGLGVPATEGVRITSTVPGLAAADAGLQANDVVVTMGDRPVSDYPSLVAALQGARAGDTLQVGFYRGSSYQSAAMTLSARWLPEIPATPAEMAAALRAMHAELPPELRKVLAGATDEQASVKPLGTSWSALETMAHLVTTEREAHLWLADMINDDERFSDRYTNATSVGAWVDALVATYPTVEGMLAALTAALSETAALVERLPEEVMAHKGNYWRIGHNLLQNDQHWHEHIEQIGDAVERAKQEA